MNDDGNWIGTYITNDDGDVIPVRTDEWAQWFGVVENRRVAETTLPNGIWVSTVFLGLDHSYTEGGPPVLWETMIFPEKGDYLDEYQERYTSLEAAFAGHQRAEKIAAKFNFRRWIRWARASIKLFLSRMWQR